MRRARIQIRPNFAARTPRSAPSTTGPTSSLGLPSVKVAQGTETLPITTVTPAIDSANNVANIVTPPVSVKPLDERGNHNAEASVAIKDSTSSDSIECTLNKTTDHLQNELPALPESGTCIRRLTKQDSGGIDEVGSNNKTSKSDDCVTSTGAFAVSKPVTAAVEDILIQPAGDELRDQENNTGAPPITEKLQTARAIVFDLDKDASDSENKEIHGYKPVVASTSSASVLSEGNGGIRNRFAKARPNLTSATSRRQNNSILFDSSSGINGQASPAGPSNVDKTLVSSPRTVTTSPTPSITSSDSTPSPVKLPTVMKRLPVQKRVSTVILASAPRDQPPDKTKMKMGELIFWNPSNNPMIYNHPKKTLRGGPQTAIDPAKPEEPADVTSIKESGSGSEVKDNVVAESGSQNDDESLMLEESTAAATIDPVVESCDKPVEGGISTVADSVNADVPKDEVDKIGAGESDDDNDDGMPVPQVRIGPDGSIVVNESSVVLAGAKLLVEQEADDDELIHETDSTVTYSTFCKKVPRKRWGPGETIKFYMALAVVGTDFALMSRMFRNRTRPEIKRKFKKEEKCNTALVEKALREGRNFDWSNFEHPFTDEDEIKKRKAIKKDNVPKAKKKSVKPKIADGPPKPKRKYVKKKLKITAAVSASDSLAQGGDSLENLAIKETKSAEICAKPKRKYTKRKKSETPSVTNTSNAIPGDDIDESGISFENDAIEKLDSDWDTVRPKRKYTRRKKAMKSLAIISSDEWSDVDNDEGVSSLEVTATEKPEDQTKAKRKKIKKKISATASDDAEDSPVNHITNELESAESAAKQKQKRTRRKKSETLTATNDLDVPANGGGDDDDDDDNIMTSIDENPESETQKSTEQPPKRRRRSLATNFSDVHVALNEEVDESVISAENQATQKLESSENQTTPKRRRKKKKKSESDVVDNMQNHMTNEPESTECAAKQMQKRTRRIKSNTPLAINNLRVLASDDNDEIITSIENLETETQLESTEQSVKRKRKSLATNFSDVALDEDVNESVISVKNQATKKPESTEDQTKPKHKYTRRKKGIEHLAIIASDAPSDIDIGESVTSLEMQTTEKPESAADQTKPKRKRPKTKKSASESNDAEEILASHITKEPETVEDPAEKKQKRTVLKKSETRSATNNPPVLASDDNEAIITSIESLETETQLESAEQPAMRKRKCSGNKRIKTPSATDYSDVLRDVDIDESLSSVENQTTKKQNSPESPMHDDTKPKRKTSVTTLPTTLDPDSQDRAIKEAIENQKTDGPACTESPIKQKRNYTRMKKSDALVATVTSDVLSDAGDMDSTLEENLITKTTLTKSKLKYTRKKKPEITAVESNADVASQNEEDMGMSQKQASRKMKSKKIKSQTHQLDSDEAAGVSQDSGTGEKSGPVAVDESIQGLKLSSNEDMKGEVTKDKKKRKRKLRVISSDDDDANEDDEAKAAASPEPATESTVDTQDNEGSNNISEESEKNIADEAPNNEERPITNDDQISQPQSDPPEEIVTVELRPKISRSRRQYKKLVKLTTRLESIQTPGYESRNEFSIESDLPEHSEDKQTESFESEADIFGNTSSNDDIPESVPDIPSASWDTELLIPGVYSSPEKSPSHQICVTDKNKVPDADDASSSSMMSQPAVAGPPAQKLKRFPPYVFSKLKSPEPDTLTTVISTSEVKRLIMENPSKFTEHSNKSPTRVIRSSSKSPIKLMQPCGSIVSVEDESNKNMSSESTTCQRGAQHAQRDTTLITSVIDSEEKDTEDESDVPLCVADIGNNSVDETESDIPMCADSNTVENKQIPEEVQRNISSETDILQSEPHQIRCDTTLHTRQFDSEQDGIVTNNGIDEAESGIPICVADTQAAVQECDRSVQPTQDQSTSDLLLTTEEALEHHIVEEDSHIDTDTGLVMPPELESVDNSAMLKDSLTGSDVMVRKFPAYIFKKSTVKSSQNQTLSETPVISENVSMETPCETDEGSFSNFPECNEVVTRSPSKVISKVVSPYKEARVMLHDICIGADAVASQVSPRRKPPALHKSPAGPKTTSRISARAETAPSKTPIHCEEVTEDTSNTCDVSPIKPEDIVLESNKTKVGSATCKSPAQTKKIPFSIKTRKRMSSLKSPTASEIPVKSHIGNIEPSEEMEAKKTSLKISRRITSAKALVSKPISAKSSIRAKGPSHKSSPAVKSESGKTSSKKIHMTSNKPGTKRVARTKPHTIDEVTLRRSPPIPTETNDVASKEIESKKISFTISKRKIGPVKTPVVSISAKSSIKDTALPSSTIAKPETGKIPSKKKLMTSKSKLCTIDEVTVRRSPIPTETMSPGRTSTRVKKTPAKYATAFETMSVKSTGQEPVPTAKIYDSSKKTPTTSKSSSRGKLTSRKASGQTHYVSEGAGSDDGEAKDDISPGSEPADSLNSTSTIIDSKKQKKIFAPYVFKNSSVETSKHADTQNNDNSAQHEQETVPDICSHKIGHSTDKSVTDANILNIINDVSSQSSDSNAYKRVHLSSETSDADAQSETEQFSVYSQDEESDEADTATGRRRRKSRLLISNELFKQGHGASKESPATSIVESSRGGPLEDLPSVVKLSEDVCPVLEPPPVNNSDIPGIVPQFTTDNPNINSHDSVSLNQNNEHDDYFDDSNDNIEIMICVDYEEDEDDNVGEGDVIVRTSDGDVTSGVATSGTGIMSPSDSSIATGTVAVVSPEKSVESLDKINLDNINSEGRDRSVSCTVSNEDVLKTISVSNDESRCSGGRLFGIDNRKQEDKLIDSIADIEATVCTSSSENQIKTSENISGLKSTCSPTSSVVNKDALDGDDLVKNSLVNCTDMPIRKTKMIRKRQKQSESKRKLSGCFPKYSPPAKTRIVPDVQPCLKGTTDSHSSDSDSDLCANVKAKSLSKNKSMLGLRTSEINLNTGKVRGHPGKSGIYSEAMNVNKNRPRKRVPPRPRIMLTNLGVPEIDNRELTVVEQRAQQSLISEQETQALTADDQQNQLANVLSSLNSSITSTNIEDPEILKQIVQNVLGSDESRQSNDKPTTLEISAVKGVPSVPGGHLVLVTQKTDDPNDDPLIFVYTLEANDQ